MPAIALPPAGHVPHFVSDAAWLMEQRVASRDGPVTLVVKLPHKPELTPQRLRTTYLVAIKNWQRL